MLSNCYFDEAQVRAYVPKFRRLTYGQLCERWRDKLSKDSMLSEIFRVFNDDQLGRRAAS